LLGIFLALRRFLGMGAAHSCSLRSDKYVRIRHFVLRTTYVPFRHFWGGVRREFMHRLSAALLGTLGFYLRDALQGGNANVVACLHVPRAYGFSPFLLFVWRSPLLFLA
jgi:hypothetical protein